MFSATVEYALRAMVVLADHNGTPRTAVQIAEISQVPPDYLLKVMQPLTRARLVIGQRGKHGGFTLAKPPSEISILDVVNAVEPIRRIESCPLRIAAHGTALCPLHRKLDNAMAQVEESLRGTTLAGLIAEPTPMKPLCGAIANVQIASIPPR